MPLVRVERRERTVGAAIPASIHHMWPRNRPINRYNMHLIIHYIVRGGLALSFTMGTFKLYPMDFIFHFILLHNKRWKPWEILTAFSYHPTVDCFSFLIIPCKNMNSEYRKQVNNSCNNEQNLKMFSAFCNFSHTSAENKWYENEILVD